MGCSSVSKLWLEILSVKGIGVSRWIRLSRSVSIEEIVRMLQHARGRSELAKLLGRKVCEPDRSFVKRQVAMLERERCGVISLSDAGYPSMLTEIHEPPPLLFYRGDLIVLRNPIICIVGSRSASRRGLIVARSLALELSRRGFTVVSGMARGIDSAAHEGALRGGGSTCAVLGCGIDIPYPPENASLAIEIADGGCLLSEFPFGTPPRKHHFPQRNRILSGLSLGVVVVEAGIGSGALGTARWAIEQNREVFAVPGPVEHPGSRGPHRLIREGAFLVEGIEDVLAELPPCGNIVAPLSAPVSSRAAHDLSSSERLVLSALELNPKHVDELVQICDISATSMLPILLDLEMKGLIEACGGGLYARAAADFNSKRGTT